MLHYTWKRALNTTSQLTLTTAHSLCRRRKMESWYGLFLNQKHRHQELLRAAARERLENDVLKQLNSTGNPPDAPADRLAGQTESRPVSPGRLRPAEQA